MHERHKRVVSTMLQEKLRKEASLCSSFTGVSQLVGRNLKPGQTAVSIKPQLLSFMASFPFF